MCASSVSLMMGRTHLLALFITEQEAVTLELEIHLEERGRDIILTFLDHFLSLGAWKQLGGQLLHLSTWCSSLGGSRANTLRNLSSPHAARRDCVPSLQHCSERTPPVNPL